MASMELNRRLFAWVLWIFAGLCLLVILASCTPFDPYASLTQPGTATPSQAATAQPSPTVTTQARPSYQVAAYALEVRTGPSEARPNIGYLARGDRVQVYATQQAREYCPSWAAINPSLTRWVCFKNLGE